MDGYGPVGALFSTIWGYSDMLKHREIMKLQVRTLPANCGRIGDELRNLIPLSPTLIFHAEMPMQIPVFCLITPVTPSS
jgi:hypothetical protein